jgi:hypothetical protein
LRWIHKIYFFLDRIIHIRIFKQVPNSKYLATGLKRPSGTNFFTDYRFLWWEVGNTLGSDLCERGASLIPDLTFWPWPTYWNFNIGYIFWLISNKALTFHMSVSCDKTFLWVPTNMIFWPWCFTHLLKTLTSAITFEWYILGLWYMSIPWDKTLQWLQKVWPCDFDLGL